MQVKVYRITLPVVIISDLIGILCLYGFQECAPQFLYVFLGESEGAGKEPGLMSTTRVIRTQTIVSDLSQINNGVMRIGKLQDRFLFPPGPFPTHLIRTDGEASCFDQRCKHFVK